MTISFESLPLCLQEECFRFLSVADLGVFGVASSSCLEKTAVDEIWRELYPSMFTQAGSVPLAIENLVNRPYRRSCIGWSVSVLQQSSVIWLTGVVLDYRNELFLVKYDFDDSEVWERETSTSGPWFTAGKLRLRFLSAPDEKTRARAPSIGEDFTEASSLQLVPAQRRKRMSGHSTSSSSSVDDEEFQHPVSSSCSANMSCTSPVGGVCIGNCGDLRHSWRCEAFRDRTQAPTRLVGELTGHTDEVLSVSFSNDGNRLASCSRDGTTRISAVDCLSTVLIIQHEIGDVPCRVVWSPNDSLLLACTEAKNGNIFDYDAQVACFDTVCGSRLFSRPNIPFDVCAQWIPGTNVFIHGESLTISPRGTYHQSLALFDCDTNRVVGRFHFRFVSEAFIHLIQVSPDGQFLAVTCGLGDALSDTVRIIRIPSLRPNNTVFEIRVPRAKFEPTKFVCSSIFRNIANFSSISISKLLSVADPCTDGDIVVPSFYCGGAVLGLAWSKDSRTFYSNTRVYVKGVHELTDRPDLDNTLEIQAWKIGEEGPYRRMKGAHGFTTKDCPFYLFLAESPCGEYVASGSEDCGVYIYHIRHGRLLRILWNGHSDVVSMVSWHPHSENGCLLASASDDHKVCLWGTSSGVGANTFDTYGAKKIRRTHV